MKPIFLNALAMTVMVGSHAMAADQKFDAADRDGDGLLSMAEIVLAIPDATPDAFKAADADQNGVLNEAEYIAAVNDGVLSEG
ncbi:MAG: EF-hand domain-containing protein [Paracoccaceae bacterium]